VCDEAVLVEKCGITDHIASHRLISTILLSQYGHGSAKHTVQSSAVFEPFMSDYAREHRVEDV
jgi:hypothetical protein